MIRVTLSLKEQTTRFTHKKTKSPAAETFTWVKVTRVLRASCSKVLVEQRCSSDIRLSETLLNCSSWCINVRAACSCCSSSWWRHVELQLASSVDQDWWSVKHLTVIDLRSREGKKRGWILFSVEKERTRCELMVRGPPQKDEPLTFYSVLLRLQCFRL